MTGAANRVVHDRIAEQVGAARDREAQVRDGLPEGVHQMRVALRRLRSALVTFRPLLDREVTEPLRTEVKWLAAELGAVRDTQVMRKRLDELVAGEPDELLLGPVRARLDAALDEEERVARQALSEALDSPRYAVLMSALDVLAAEPPWASGARSAGAKVLRKRIRHDFRRVRRAVDELSEADDRAQRDERLHEVRKSAKRARYAAEAVESRYGDDAADFAEAMESIQTILGDQHDAVIALDRLRAAADEALAQGDSAFSFGRLHAQEQREADDLVASFEEEWPKAKRKRLRRWLG